MAYIVKIPKLGLTMTEGTLFKWHKKEGDAVKAGETLFELATDKLVNEVEAEEDGVLIKVLMEEGKTSAVGTPVAVIANAGEDISYLIKDKSGKNEDYILPKTSNSDIYILATPLAKKTAKENNIDLESIVGTGEKGVILTKDVTAAAENNKATVKATPMAKKMARDMDVDLGSMTKEGRIVKEDVIKVSSRQEAENKQRKAAPSRIRRIIAERMLESSITTAAVNYSMEVDVTELKALREKLNIYYKSKGIKFSYNHIFIKAAAKALMENPEMNAYFDGEDIVYHDYVNLGVAVAVGKELIVPNLKNAEGKTLEQIAVETEKLINGAREGALSSEDLSGGTFTITNLGSFGMDSFSPIINKPEIGILGINTMKDKPVVLEGEITIRTMTNINLTADHRLVDGAASAVFLGRIKEMLENPYLIFV